MEKIKEIGGYFELYLEQKNVIKDDIISLNLARNCLKYTIRAFDIKEIYLPYYTCPIVWQTVNKENCKIKFYHIDKNFMPVVEFLEDDFILYINYFGVCAKNVKMLAKKYKNLIVDNSQAFYMPKYGISSFNSLRKFFPVSDGAFLEIDKKLNEEFAQDTSYQRFSHLLKRADVSMKFGYDDFYKNEDTLQDLPIKTISNLTKSVFESLDIEKARQIRLENYKILDESLDKTNELKVIYDKDNVPMNYPYFVRNENLRKNLIKNKIYVEQYWSPMGKDTAEGDFQKYLIPLPIDQRYNKDDMKRIIEIIKK